MKDITLRDGTVFKRTPVGSFWGSPTPEQVQEIEESQSSFQLAAVVRTCNVGDLCGHLTDGFELHYFDR